MLSSKYLSWLTQLRPSLETGCVGARTAYHTVSYMRLPSKSDIIIHPWLHSYSRTPYQLWLYQSIYFNYHVLDRTLNWDHDPRIHNFHRNRISNTGSRNVSTNPDPKHSLVSWCASSSYYPRPSSFPLLALYQTRPYYCVCPAASLPIHVPYPTRKDDQK